MNIITDKIQTTYNSLNFIDDNILNIHIKNPTILEVGKIFKKYSLNDKYCLHLLHNHYKLRNDEIIFKKIYHDTIITNVIDSSDVPAPLEGLIVSPTIFKFKGNDLIAIEMGFLPEYCRFNEEDFLAFKEISELLERENLSDIFGLGFRLNLYNVVDKKKTFLEATHSDRSQKMTLVDEELAYSDKYKAKPTCWIFNPGDDGSVVAACPYSCANDPEGEHGHGSEHTGESY